MKLFTLITITIIINFTLMNKNSIDASAHEITPPTINISESIESSYSEGFEYIKNIENDIIQKLTEISRNLIAIIFIKSDLFNKDLPSTVDGTDSECT